MNYVKEHSNARVTQDDQTSPSVEPSRSMTIIAFCFLLSGFAALLYETVWLRQFAILLGTSEQALAIVLASYMGGLALGSALAIRYVDRISRPLLTYGILEAGIAIAALAMPIGLMIVRAIQPALFAGADQPPDAGSLSQMSFGFVSAFTLIVLPTAMMGATLPLLTKHVVHRDEELGPRIAWLYAINTLGAVAGTLFAAFVCLPTLGLVRTVWVGVAANLAVFALVWWLSKTNGRQLGSPEVKSQSLAKQQSGTSLQDRRFRWVVVLIAFSGAISFCYEIVFTRMLGHVIGGSTFAFATMLSGFLLGITIGSAIATRFALTRRTAAIGFAYAQCLAAISGVAAYQALNTAAGWPLKERFGESSILMFVTLSIAVLLPTAICVGATIPLAIRIWAASENDAASASARVYMWNVLGAIAGSVLTGAYLLPALEYEGAARVAVVGNLVLAISAMLLFQISRKHYGAVVVGLAVLIGFIPRFPENVMRRSAIAIDFADGYLIHTDVGRSATVALFQQPMGIQLRTNGLPEARVTPRGDSLTTRGAGVWLSALPPLLRPEIESMLIVGLGGGIAASSVPPSVQQIDVFELEPGVVEANRLISDHRESDPLLDSRLSVILNDGRNGLHLTSKTYDSIVSQPSHPWTAGASHLFTREFAEIASEHLTDRGVFLQWMSTEFVDMTLMKSMTASLVSVFPHVRLYCPTHDQLLFVAGKQPIDAESIETQSAFIPRVNRDYYLQLGITSPTDLYGILRLDTKGAKDFSSDSRPITDDRNLFATRLPVSGDAAHTAAIAKQLAPLRPLFRDDFDRATSCPTLNPYSLLVYRHWDFSDAETRQLIAMITDPVEHAIVEAVMAKRRGDWNAYGQSLVATCKKHPEDPRAAFLLLADNFTNPKVTISVDQMQVLGELLDERYTTLIEAISASTRSHWEILKERDDVLASVRRDDVAFPFVPALRASWRIYLNDSDQRASAREAIRIIDRSGVRFNDLSLSWHRTAAAMRGNRPHVALTTVQHCATGVATHFAEDKTPTMATVKKFEGMLARCVAEIDDPSDFEDVSEDRYEFVRNLADAILLELQQAIGESESVANDE